MRLNHPNDELGGMLLLMLPQVVVHEIDASSPLMPPPYWSTIDGTRPGNTTSGLGSVDSNTTNIELNYDNTMRSSSHHNSRKSGNRRALSDDGPNIHSNNNSNNSVQDVHWHPPTYDHLVVSPPTTNICNSGSANAVRSPIPKSPLRSVGIPTSSSTCGGKSAAAGTRYDSAALSALKFPSVTGRRASETPRAVPSLPSPPGVNNNHNQIHTAAAVSAESPGSTSALRFAEQQGGICHKSSGSSSRRGVANQNGGGGGGRIVLPLAERRRFEEENKMVQRFMQDRKVCMKRCW
jgi:hypothetical protein